MKKKYLIFLIYIFLIKNIYSQETFVISLGPDCYPALAFRDFQIRPFALPFDWLITDDFAGINKLLEDNFKYMFEEKFLEYRNHVVKPTTLIRNTYYNLSFIHDFPVSNNSDILHDGTEVGTIVSNWTDFIEKVKQKFLPRIARLYNLIKSNKRLVFIRSKEISLQQINNFVHVINQINPNANYVLAIIHNNPALHNNLNLPKIKSIYTPRGLDKALWIEIFKMLNINFFNY